jgi:hypothetical protein
MTAFCFVELKYVFHMTEMIFFEEARYGVGCWGGGEAGHLKPPEAGNVVDSMRRACLWKRKKQRVRQSPHIRGYRINSG